MYSLNYSAHFLALLTEVLIYSNISMERGIIQPSQIANEKFIGCRYEEKTLVVDVYFTRAILEKYIFLSVLCIQSKSSRHKRRSPYCGTYAQTTIIIVLNTPTMHHDSSTSSLERYNLSPVMAFLSLAFLCPTQDRPPAENDTLPKNRRSAAQGTKFSFTVVGKERNF